MKLALVNHDRLELPEGGYPLNGGSIALWCFHLGTRLASEWEVEVHSPMAGRFRHRERRHAGVRFVDHPTGLDQRWHHWHRRLRSLIGRTGDATRPAFAGTGHLLLYGLRVGFDLRRRRVDVVHVSNFSQLVPLLRRIHPRACYVLHMQCEWLTQLDPALVEPRLRLCDGISGCSEFVVDGIRSRFPAHAKRCFALWNGVDIPESGF